MTTKPEAQPKKRINSKQKGSTFEGGVAKKLSQALPINFIRSPGSGARIGGKNFATMGKLMGEEVMKLFNADVVPINERETGVTFRYSIECKSYKEADNFTSIANGSANIFKWFTESVVDSGKIGRDPVLIFKWNRTPTFVAVLARTMEGMVTPLMTIHHKDGFHLDIYDFDELLNYKDFWINGNSTDGTPQPGSPL